MPSTRFNSIERSDLHRPLPMISCAIATGFSSATIRRSASNLRCIQLRADVLRFRNFECTLPVTPEAIAYEARDKRGCSFLSLPLVGRVASPILFIGLVGWGEPQRKPRSWLPPPRPPLLDDASHRPGSADPPHKGEGLFTVITLKKRT